MSALLLRRQRPRFRTRPFFVSTALIFGLVAIQRLVPGIVGPSSHTSSSSSSSSSSSLLLRRNDDYPVNLECRLVHNADDQCAFVLANCGDEAAGLLPYISFYYCSMQRAQPLAFVMLVAWLGLLFTTIGIAASDFFSVNLGTIANSMGLSESLAGVTFLAFGNGSPDVFSTFAAMGSNSGSMAVGELIGAAGFITGVVAGSMALVREFRVSRRTFVRDICFFIVSVAFAMVFLADGKLMFWECCVMISFYIFYVVTVVGWHWVSKQRSRRRAREAASRGQYYGTIGSAGDGDGDLAPYHDNDTGPGAGGEEGGGGNNDDDDDDAEPDDTAVVGSGRARPPPDISALERGPRIEVNSVMNMNRGEVVDAGLDGEARDVVVLSEEQQERRNRHINAEMTSSMRVNRPRGRRSTTSMNPIRPSLLGALEFRSVLASLQKSGTMHLAPIVRRRLTASGAPDQGPPGLSRGYSASAVSAIDDSRRRRSLAPQDAYRDRDHHDAVSRDRALSSGDQPLSWAVSQSVPDLPPYSDFGPLPAAAMSAGVGAGLDAAQQTSGSSITEAAKPATPTLDGAQRSAAPSPPINNTPSLPTQSRPTLSGLRLEIPTSPQQPSGHSAHSSPALSPFPGFPESPGPFSPLAPLPPSRTSSMPLGPQAQLQRDDGSSFPGIDDHNSIHKPVKWWPYNVLPPPHVIFCTLFPSLVGWREKTIWDRFVSLISAPTIFLLVITLPVVEMEAPCDDDDDNDDNNNDEVHGLDATPEAYETIVPTPVSAATGGSAPLLVVPGTETEWQRYRRSTNTMRPLLSPVIRALQESDGDSLSSTAVSMRSSASAAEGAPIVDNSAHHGLHPHQYRDHLRPDDPHHGHPASSRVAEPPAQSEQSEGQSAGATAVAASVSAMSDAVGGWNRWLVAVQLVAGPLFATFVLWANTLEEMARPGRDLCIMLVVAAAVAGGMLAVLFATTTAKQRPKYHSLLCFVGFVVSVTWISTVAGEVVGVLKAIGVIVGISEAILGLTIFAVGNSLGDLVADITVARLGYPVMALSACFGGPMLNILLGVGVGGAWMTTKAAKDREHAHPGQPRHYEPYEIQVGSTLLVSAVTVLVTLVFLLVAVPANKWMMTRQIGLALIGLWTVSTMVNVLLEVSGPWR